jgi:hypothetical protein
MEFQFLGFLFCSISVLTQTASASRAASGVRTKFPVALFRENTDSVESSTKNAL